MGESSPGFGGFEPLEVVLFFLSAAGCVVGAKNLVRGARNPSWLRQRRARLGPLYGAMICGFFVVAVTIRWWAAKEVRASAEYSLLALMMAGAWLALMLRAFEWLGISLRLDVFEQRNQAAVWALAGVAFGVLVTYAGANAGEGPSFANNVLGAVLAMVGLALLWIVLAALTGVARAISADRDLKSGLRVAAFFAAESVVLGRAIAGDWHSTEATQADFVRDGWPGLLLLAAAVIGEKACRSRRAESSSSWVSQVFVPALSYLGLAAIALAHLGWWEHGAATP